MTDFIPGDPANSVSVEGMESFNKAASTIADAETAVDAMDAAIVVPLAEAVKSAESACEHIASVVVGEINDTISDAEKVIGKIAKKINTSNETLMREAYSYMDLLGIPVPTEQDLSYAESTGNYLGSVGVGFPQTVSMQTDSIVGSVGNDSITQINQTDSNNQTLPKPPVVTGSNQVPGNTPIDPYSNQSETYEPTTRQEQSQLPPGYPPGTNLCLGLVDYIGVAPYDGWRDISKWSQSGLYDPVSFSKSNINQDGLPDGFSIYAVCQSNTDCNISVDGGTIDPARVPAGASFWVIAPNGWVPWYRSSERHVFFSPNVPPGACALKSTRLGLTVAGGGEGGIVPPAPAPAPVNEVCPLPDKLCGPDLSWKNLPGQALDEDVCKQLETAIRKLTDDNIKFTDFVGMSSGVSQGSWVTDAIINAFTGGNQPILGGLLTRFANWAQTAVTASANSVNCGGAAMVNVSIKQAILNFVQHWTSIVPMQIIEETQQVSNTVCQSLLPSGSEADAAYLSDTITKEEWECWQKAEGNHIGPATKLLDGKRERITARQADQLYRQKRIDEAEMSKRMREAGVLRDEDKFAIRDLNIHWPGVSDTVRFMQRDVFDQDVVDTAKLDEDFDKKFTGKAVDYADALGVDEQLMKYHWRSHWHLPSYTMGREFLYRFNDQELPDTIRFTEEDFRKMLKQDDWAPGYIDRMIAASYHPINRTDAIKSYMIHFSSDDEFIDQLIKTGYNKDNATFMQGYYKKRREINDRKASGYPTLRTAVNAYARCEMAENEFNEIVNDITIDDAQTEAAFKAARLSRKVWERKQAIRTIKRPYVLGLSDDVQTTTDLANAGVDPGCVDDLLTQWQRERMRRDKYLSASTLCQMRESGIISPQQQVIALVRSGWAEEDAVLIAEECAYRLSEKAANRARIMAEKAARELEKQRKAQEKAARLAECGPPPCPANRQQNTRPVAAGQ